MRLPVCDGQAQPEASTSGRPHDYYGATGSATWRRGRASMHRQAKRQSATLLPMWPSAPASKNRQLQNLTCTRNASIETHDARLQPPQVPAVIPNTSVQSSLQTFVEGPHSESRAQYAGGARQKCCKESSGALEATPAEGQKG